MIKRILLVLEFLLNILAIDIHLASGSAFITLYLLAINFVVGFLSAFLQFKLSKSILFLVINVFVAFCVGMAIYGYTILFPSETNFIPRNPFEGFLAMCPFALASGFLGIILNFGIRKLITRLNAQRNRVS